VTEETRIELVGAVDPHEELASLSRWLGDDDEFRGRIRLVRAPLADGAMGGLPEALSVGLAGGGALTLLAGSVSVWLKQRRSVLTVKITHRDGSSQEITAAGPAADALAAKVDPHRQPPV
jgi:Effector Associated Constant Component 1